jgi:amino acid adenylation domain-containing protein/non-ribosomal peptide synthase protein (TIGR01720 family)
MRGTLSSESIGSGRGELLRRRLRAALARPAADAIARVTRDQPLPLSFAQERLWFLDRVSLAGPAYHISLALRLTGRLDRAALAAALTEIVRRHEALRTRFVMGESGGVQLIDPPWPVELDAVSADAAAARQRLRAVTARPFDLACDRLLRCELLQLGTDEHVLALVLHHIVSDGWSMRVLLRELAADYAAAVAGRSPAREELPIQYVDYAVWHRGFVAERVLAPQLAYWSARLAGAPAGLDLPADRPRPPVQSFRGATHRFAIGRDVTTALTALARGNGATLFMVLLAAFKVVLRRWSGQTDVIVGTPVAGRTRAETEGLIGFFVNLLALRTDLAGDPSFREVLLRVKASALAAYAHQDLPFERLVDVLQPARDLSRQPVFQVVFALQDVSIEEARLPGLAVEPFDDDERSARFDLELAMTPADGRLEATLAFATDLFESATVARLAGHLVRLLEGAASDPDRRLSELPLLSVDERVRLLSEWSGTAAPEPQQCLHQMFAAQVARTPDWPAVICGDQTLSYGALDRRANRLAHHLRAHDVGSETIVALCVGRSANMVAGVLGILKAGAAYLPLDPAYPPDRLAYMLIDAGAPVVVSEAAIADRLPTGDARVIRLDADWPAIAREPETAPPDTADPDNLAYVIYTSGSTGRPKGVMVPHRGAANLADAQRVPLAIAPGSRVLQFASLSFDAAVWELLMSWASGAGLVMADRHDLLPGEPLRSLLESQAINAVLLPPSALAALPAASLPQLTTLILGGEALSREAVAPWLPATAGGQERIVLNAYGPTESSVCTTVSHIIPDDRPPAIGRPLANARVYVLDPDFAPVPIGAVGELFIGGAGLARGYLARPALTAERFIPSPFTSGERLYRTGDLVRFRRDGELEFLGRSDHQVKIRGFRIEPGEIEAVLRADRHVLQAAVVVREDMPGSKRLVAYVVPDPQQLKLERREGARPDDDGVTQGDDSVTQRDDSVTQWQSLFDETYAAGEAGEAAAPSFIGWNSSYTGAPIPAAEMQEWLARTVERIVAFQPHRALEIGCGVGLVLQQVAPLCETYCATDISRAALMRLKAWIEGEPQLRHVELALGDAAALPELAPATFDTVILNSVVQYFPDIDYVRAALKAAASLTADGGRIFVGDLRHFGLLRLFHASVETARASGGVGIGALRSRVAGALRREAELAVDPAFFTALRQELPRLSAVEVLVKRGGADNELTRYRYDAILHVGGTPAQAPAETVDWAATSLAGLAVDLAARRPPSLRVAGVANRRLARDLARLRLLDSLDPDGVAAELAPADGDQDVAGVDPEAFWSLGERLGYEVQVSWAAAAPDGAFDVLFVDRARIRGPVASGHTAARRQPWASYANDPAAATLAHRLGGRLRQRLRAELPEHMVPSAIVVLDALPLTPAGKLDRAALPPPEARPETSAFVPPRTPAEHRLAAIWCEILKLDRVGVTDNFFELGGDSIQSIQVVARAGRAELKLTSRQIFEHQTIAELAAVAAPADLPALAHLGPLQVSETDRARMLDLMGGNECVEDIQLLSPTQQGMWFHSLYEPQSSVYVTTLSCRLLGPLDGDMFARAWEQVVARHSVLRSAFVGRDLAQPLQVVLWQAALPVARHDWRKLSAAEQQARLAALEEADCRQGFDFLAPPMMRLSLLRTGEHEHRLTWTCHHILFDGWSIPVLLNDVFASYAALVRGEAPGLAPVPPYRDYLAWLARQDLAPAQNYWRGRLAGFAAPSTLGLDRPAAAARGDRHAELIVQLPIALETLATFARRHRVTVNTLVQAAWALLLGRYGDSTDVVFGVTVSGRPADLPEIERMVGLFITTLPLRVAIPREGTVVDFLRAVQERQTELMTHQHAPLSEVQRLSEVPAGTPLFDSIVVFENFPAELAAAEVGLRLDDIRAVNRLNYPLALQVATEPALVMKLMFDASHYGRDDIARVARHLSRLLAGIIADRQRSLAAVPMLDETERRQMLVEWNDTVAPYPAGCCLHDLVTAQAARSPGAIALVHEDRTLTYGDLDRRTNQLAHHLRGMGAGPDVVVGLCVERSFEMVIGLLGILKAGGAWLPLDPDYPADRLAFMLNDAGVRLVLTTAAVAERLPPVMPGLVRGTHVFAAGAPGTDVDGRGKPGHDGEGGATSADHAAAGIAMLRLDADWPDIARQPERAPANVTNPDHLAYVIYTSGSTGKPKGVMNAHRGIVNRIQWMQDAYQLTASDRVLQKTPFSFDVSVWEFFWPLAFGARLVIARPGGHQDPRYLSELIERQGVTITHFVPSMLQAFLETADLRRCGSLRDTMCSGEALPAETQNRFLAGLRSRLHNLYGPTEAAVDVSAWECRIGPQSSQVPIGRPISNIALYVLDRHLEPVPIGVVGELYIGGVGLARGYLGRPGLTAERFVPNPFAQGERLYRTGDLARLRADGEIEFLGRIDHQVKIRGFRIELGEIEATLLAHADVEQAAVIAREDSSRERRLVGYVVGHGDAVLEAADLRRHLQQSLPDHMVPAAFVQLDHLPLSPNGKLDRKALPAPEIQAQSTVAPRNETEQALATIFAEVLRLERVGVHDNFFELGGDSIQSIQVVSRASRAGLTLSPRQIFEHQTVAGLAAVAGSAVVERAEQGLVAGEVPLTPIQHWFFAQNLAAPHHFNQAVLLQCPPLQPELLQEALQHLVGHHDALRLRFRHGPAGWQQAHAKADEVALVQLDLSGFDPAQRPKALSEAAERLQASLDLAKGPLLRAALIDLGADGQRLLLIIHHLVVDGVSWRILLEDLAAAYGRCAAAEAVELPPKTTSFKRWAQLLAAQAGSAEELAFWQAVPWSLAPKLPRDHDGDNSAGSVRMLRTRLDAAETRALLQEVPAAYRTRINDVLLTALAKTFAGWTGEQQLLIDLEGHGRDALTGALDVSRTVGWFTSLFPVLLDLGPAADLGTALRAVKEQLRAIPRNGIGYGLLRYLCQTELPQPQPEVSFNYLGQLDLDSAGFRFAGESFGALQGAGNRRAHLIDISAHVADGCLELQWFYSAAVHAEATLAAMAESYLTQLRDLIAHCRASAGGLTPSDVPLAPLAPAELDRLVAAAGGARQVEDIYPLSALQQGLLFHSLYEPQSAVYVISVSCRLEGPLDPDAFAAAWQTVVARHAVLRSAFLGQDLERPVQVVLRRAVLPIARHDWCDLPVAEQEARFSALCRAERERGFDFARPPLMRLALLQFGESDHRLIWNSHHLLLDGWSIPRLLDDVFAAYAALGRGEAPQLSPVRPYRDYIAWLRQQDLAAAEGYWRERLSGFTAPTELGLGRPAAGAGERYAEYDRVVALPELETFARRHRVTVNTLVQAAWALLLGRYGNSRDVVFGVTVSGRPAELADVERMVGLFINTLPLRLSLDPEQTVVDFLRQVQARQSELISYQYAPLPDVQRASELPTGTPLFESILAFENYPTEMSATAAVAQRIRISEIRPQERTNYPLTLQVTLGAALSLRLIYDTERFGAEGIAGLLGHVSRLLGGLIANGEQPLAAVPMLDDAERRQLITGWNNTAAAYPSDHCLHELFAAQAATNPGATALAYDGRTLSYGALEARTNQLAHHLRGLGVGPDVVVGLCIERSFEMVVGLLGILKAGGAYLPLDPDYPTDRLAFMQADAQAPVVLTTAALAERLPSVMPGLVPGIHVFAVGARGQDVDGRDKPGHDGRRGATAAGHAAAYITMLRLDVDWPDIARQPETALENISNPGNLAYVIYTSGSTGKPKGVMNAHRGIVNRIQWMQDAYRLTASDRVLQKTPFGFDVSVWEFFWPLAFGARLVIARPGGHQDPRYLSELIERQSITITHFVPSMLQAFLETADLARCDSLRDTMCSGEALAAETQNRFLLGLRSRLHNLYGPTEAAVDVSAWECRLDGGSQVPIGRPISNIALHVLDRAMEPVPVGVAGELYIGGVGLARGYLGRPALTAERFVPNPFGSGERLYRTGDLARLRADGEIEFLGRIDHQVKIRGVRIELGEIEAALLTHSGIEQAAVVAREDRPGERRLVAYLVGCGGPVPGAAALRHHLQQSLPDPMVPSAFVPLDRLPLSPNGKLDRKALPAPELPPPSIVAPRSPAEETLATIFAEVLRLRQVGVHDDFFALGGDSLVATRAVARIERETGIALGVRTIFEAPTVARLAERIELLGWFAPDASLAPGEDAGLEEGVL